ncbi:single-stranded DNA-binding protein, partial [Nocardiopsis sp. NPDC007018]
IVQGRLKQRSFETREGEKRTVFEIDVEEVGPALRSATAKVTKNAPSGRQGSGFGGAASAPQGGYSPAQPQGGDPWGQGGRPGFSDDAPPF